MDGGTVEQTRTFYSTLYRTLLFPRKFYEFDTEGNSWHYSWSVFHDVQGLIDLMGGKDVFISMMDSVFSMPPDFDESYYGQVIHEIREMQNVYGDPDYAGVQKNLHEKLEALREKYGDSDENNRKYLKAILERKKSEG